MPSIKLTSKSKWMTGQVSKDLTASLSRFKVAVIKDIILRFDQHIRSHPDLFILGNLLRNFNVSVNIPDFSTVEFYKPLGASPNIKRSIAEKGKGAGSRSAASSLGRHKVQLEVEMLLKDGKVKRAYYSISLPYEMFREYALASSNPYWTDSLSAINADLAGILRKHADIIKV